MMIFLLFPCIAFDIREISVFPYGVSEVKNERNCNASHIFASVSAFESAYAFNQSLSSTINFSEQFALCNCSSIDCGLGNPSDVLECMSTLGIYKEWVFPYFGQKIILPETIESPVLLPYFKQITVNTTIDFYLHLIKYPLIVGFQIDNLSNFTGYRNGIYECDSKSNGKIHYMLAVYDSSCSDESCILLKNNWGIGWGENGFMRLSTEASSSQGPCGIFNSFYIASFTQL